jgi:DNA polymerase III sliding clamp (beta) subunit (PCNA family)
MGETQLKSHAVLIPREVGALRTLTADDPRYALQCIRIEPNGSDKVRAVVTDGYKLLAVDYPRIGCEEFPSVPGFNPNGFDGVNVPKDTLERACKAAPKRTGRNAIPVLCNIALTTNDGAMTFAATDLESPTVLSAKAPDRPFLRYQEAIPADEGGVEVTFNARYMIDILKAMVEATKTSGRFGSSVTLRVFPMEVKPGCKAASQKPMRLSCEGQLGTAVAVLMPRDK